MHCSRCQHDNSTSHTYCSKCGTPLKRSPASRSYTELERDLTEALEQQTATREILRVISSSPTDLQPVFNSILRSAVQLSDARMGGIYRFDGELIHLAGIDGATPDAAELHARRFPRTPDRGFVVGRAILERGAAQMPDALSDPEFESKDFARAAGWRSSVSVPMLRGGVPIGAVSVARTDIGPFSASVVGLLQTFADQAVIAIENVRLFKELEEKNRALTEALEQQTATAEVLRVIGSSPTDAQPVFEAIVSSARRLLSGFGGAVYRVAGDEIHLAAYISTNPSGDAALRSSFPRPLADFSPPSEAIRRRAPVVLTDIETDRWIPDDIRELIRKRGDRRGVWVPMMREGMALGAIGVTRSEPGSFEDEQIALLRTFADQAVIAIENVRLFTELEARNRDLTATSQILQVISRSPTDVQPVFEAIADSAVRLFDALGVAVVRYDGELISMAAARGGAPGSAAAASDRFRAPHRPIAGFPPEQTVLTRTVHHVADVDTDPSSSAEFRRHARERGFRSVLSMPMLRGGDPVGVIVVSRAQPGPFSTAEVELLHTFADQAVIAIENVRLFTELEARNRDLTEALDQQTATGEILHVISRSQTDVQPVFDTIVRSAVRLCNGLFCSLLQVDGELVYNVAQHNYTPEALEEVHRIYPTRPTRALPSGRAILECAVVHIPDVEVDPEFHNGGLSRAIGWRSGLFVPMLRAGAAIGAIAVTRAERGPFSDTEIELLKTFADQAVIAVENVRLFKELEARTAELTRSVGELTALGEVSHALSSTLDLDTVLTTVVNRAVELAGADGGSIFEYDENAEEFQPRVSTEVEDVVVATQRTPLRKGEGAVGRIAVTREAVQIPDIAIEGAYESRARGALLRSGRHALLAVPLLSEQHIIGGLVISRNAAGAFPAEVVALLQTFATQSALAIQNARLFHEIADKSRQLEAASRHKSEFLANMSHELRTPLNAIIGFSEVLAQGMFGDINEKQTEYLHDILESGRHLLSLINDILDLSKIEAGRMELELTDFNVPQAIQNALTLVRERALRRGIALQHVIDDRVADIRADERKVKQILLNLLSNAIKFTPEGGRIDVRAAPAGGLLEVSVSDSGVGIAPADQEAVFEEFRQVGTADKKAEGTGLGLALSRKFIELHGGQIRVTSQVGIGSTFTFTLPLRGDR